MSRRLAACSEAEELSAYLELPAAELQLVQNIVVGRMHQAVGAVAVEEEEEEEEATYDEEPDSPSAVAWKKQARW